MTNDEAINVLKNTAWLGSAEQAEKVSEAVRMAVEALKRETSDDAISRQAAIDDLHGRDPSQVWDTADVEVWINALPSVQPYTDEEIQKIQELEQAQLDKAFELGGKSAKAEIIHCGECKHADCARKDVLGRIYCFNHGFYWDALAYCSYAERRTDD